MPRRLIVTREQIYARRASAWENHYTLYKTAVIMCESGRNGVQIAARLNMDYPQPEMGIDGYLLDVPLTTRQRHDKEIMRQFGLGYNYELLCKWYWTKSGWDELVRTYQALPDVWDDFYFQYQPAPIDRAILVPVSSKPKQGSGKKVQVGLLYRNSDNNPVDKSVDNSGTTQSEKVQVRQFQEIGRR